MSFDIATAIMVSSLLTLGVGACLSFAAWRYPANLRGAMRVWIGGLFLQTAALLAVALLGPIPSVGVLVGSNMAYALAYAEMGRALTLFTGRPVRWWPLLLVAALGLDSFLFSAVWPHPHLRVALDALPVAALQFLVAHAILRGRSVLRPADWVTGVLFIGCGVLALTRSGVEFVGPLLGMEGLPTVVRYVFLVFSAVLPALGTIGFVLMCADQLNADLARLAMVDPLTGVFNRRTLAGLAETAIDAARRQRRPLSLLALDVDHFKRINDEYGHDTGDEALLGLVALLREVLRADEVLSRIGGEEFAILLRNVDDQAALAVAERVRRHVAASPLAIDGRMLGLHVSIGVATLREGIGDLGDLLRDADRALYAAKRAGRNRVVASTALAAGDIARDSLDALA
jgi:diguanylate cyclase (GGDEF)-like protein